MTKLWIGLFFLIGSVVCEDSKASPPSHKAAAKPSRVSQQKAKPSKHQIHSPKGNRKTKNSESAEKKLSLKRPAPVPPSEPSPRSRTSLSTFASDHFLRREIGISALSFLDTPYRFGAEGPHAFDCSGLVKKVFAGAGFSLPRTSVEQSQLGEKVEKRELLPGDLLFFSQRPTGKRVSHVGIYLGEGKFVHASTSSGVMVSSLGEEYWQKHYVTAKRVVMKIAQASMAGFEALGKRRSPLLPREGSPPSLLARLNRVR